MCSPRPDTEQRDPEIIRLDAAESLAMAKAILDPGEPGACTRAAAQRYLASRPPENPACTRG